MNSYFQAIMREHTGHLICMIMLPAVLVLFSVSISLLIAVATDRYWAICHPISYFKLKNSGRVKWSISISVVSGTVGGIIPIFWNNGYDDKCQITHILPELYMLLCCCVVFGSSAFITIQYFLIYRTIKMHVSII